MTEWRRRTLDFVRRSRELGRRSWRAIEPRLRARRWRVAAAGGLVGVLVVAVVVWSMVPQTPRLLTREPAGFALSPDGDDVPRLAPITVTFPDAPSERAPQNLLQLAPEAKGTYAWLSSRTLLFQPDFPGLLRGTAYTVNVPARPEAGVPRPVEKRFTVTGRLTVQQVIPADGDTEVPLNAQVLVQFSRSVAPLTTLAVRSQPVLNFEPKLEGKGEWLNTSIYRFIPQGLAPAATYRLKIPKELSSAVEGTLQEDYTATFTTAMPAVATITPADNTEFAGPRQPVVIAFNQPMDRSAAAGIAVRDPRGASVPGSIAWSEGDSVATFTPSVALGPKERHLVAVAKGLKGARTGETASERTSRFTTVGRPAVESTQPANGSTIAERFGVGITFTNPMDTDSLEGKLTISGFTAEDLEGNVFIHERGISAGISLLPSAQYTVQLAAGARDRYGQQMGAHTFSFATNALPSSVSFALPGYLPAATYSATKDQVLYFHATNTSSVEFTLYPLTPAEARSLLHDPGALRNGFKPSQQPLRRWTESVRAQKDIAVLGSTSLGASGPLPKGNYLVRGGGGFQSEFAFAVVDTVVVTKLSQDELLAWVLDHDTGAPLAGVAVKANGEGLADAVAMTDRDGLASFAVPVPRLGSNVDRGYFLGVEAGARHGVASTRWQQGTAPYQFGLPIEYYAREWVGHVYTDRPIYRPGEAVEYRGIVRRDDDARYSLPPAEPPLELVMQNARGQEVLRHGVRLNEFGTFVGRLELPTDAPLGDYWLRLNLTGTVGREHFDIVTQGFRVAEFRKPEFLVDVSAGRPSYVNGDRIEGQSAATFLFGGPVAGAPVEWSWSGEPAGVRLKGYERYSFSDFDYWRQSVADPARGSGSSRTGPDGIATHAFAATLPRADSAYRFTLSASVLDDNGQAVAGNTSVTVHPAALYAGLRSERYVVAVGDDAALDLVTVDTEGAAVPRREVVVKVYERQWVTTKEQVPGGARRYRSEPRDTLVATLAATTDAKGEARVSYRPQKAGTLRVVAEIADAQGRVARSAAYLWVTGGSFASWQVTTDDTIALVADRESYEVGETAEVLVPAPFTGAIGLVAVERGKVITRAVQRFATNSERLRIPITDGSVPNVFVSVVLYRAPTTADPVPRYKVGYVQLTVSTRTRALAVDVRPDRPQARPGETVGYDVRVTDASGRGVRSEVSVAVVDKAVLSLEEERGPDGLRAFWFERGLAVTSASSMSVSVDRANDVYTGAAATARESKGGATGGFGQQAGIRVDFRNTAYWNGQLATKDDGTARFEVKMPDSLTTWRAQVRAVSGNTMVGENTNELTVTQALLLRPALPRFLRVGDDLELRVLVSNTTGADVDAAVTLEARGVTLSDARPRSAKVAAGRSVTLGWPAKAEAEGTATVTFRASGSGSLADAISLAVPVVLDVTPETTATGGIVARDPALEAVYLPPFAITKHGSLTVSVQSALAGSMAEELQALRPLALEGTERIASRLLATLGVRRAEKSARGTSTGYDGRIASDLAALVGRQRPDGGWPWCEDARCASDRYISGWVLIALGEARRDGLTFDEGVLDRASRYIVEQVNRVSDVVSPVDPSEKAFLLAALAGAGRSEVAVAPARALLEQDRERLASWGRAYLLLALTAGGAPGGDPMVRTLLNDLAAATLPDANGNHWEDPRTRGPFMTTSATTALVGLALVRVQPAHQLLPQTVRWLVVARGAERWQTSIDRAFGVLALTSYATHTGELGGDYTYKVSVGEREVLGGTVKPGEPPKTASSIVPLTTITPGAVSIVALERDYDRPGRLYYTMNLRYVTPAREIEALNRGFAVSHEYTSLDDPATPIRSAKLGDVVRVKLTVIAPAERHYAVVEDLLPAGLEAIDARLRIVDPGLKARLEADRLAAAQRTGGPSYVAPWFKWYYSPWQHVELRDDRAVLSTDRLPKGVYEYVYYARATAPGDFFVAPARAEQTYFPDVFGRSDSGRFLVR